MNFGKSTPYKSNNLRNNLCLIILLSINFSLVNFIILNAIYIGEYLKNKLLVVKCNNNLIEYLFNAFTRECLCPLINIISLFSLISLLNIIPFDINCSIQSYEE